MPGVVVKTAPRGGSGAPLVAPSGTWFVAGITERGDTTAPIELRGPSDYTRLCGDPTGYDTLSDQITTFFKEGGARVYVARLVGPGATVGSLTLVDRAGSPLSTLRVDAASPGSWSSRLTVAVADGSDPGTFRLTVLLDGNAVEDKDNLVSPAAAAAAFASSVYVRVTDLGSATAAPNNIPAILPATAMTTQGSDDRASIVDAVRTGALARFPASLGDGAVSIPGSSSQAVYDGIRQHCEDTNRVGILAAARGTTAATLTSTAEEFAGVLGAEFCALYAPWILVPNGAGGTKAISPEGFVAACRNRAHEQVGPWRIAAGDIAAARYVDDLDAPFDDATADDLDATRVNVLRLIGGVPTVYGGRSLSSDETDYYWLKNRDLLNYISVEGAALLRSRVFHNIDSRGHLLNDLKQEMVGFLEPIRLADGLFEKPDPNSPGSFLDPGYSVDVGEAVNPVSSLQQQKASVQVSVRPTPGASLIELSIIEVALTAAV